MMRLPPAPFLAAASVLLIIIAVLASYAFKDVQSSIGLAPISFEKITLILLSFTLMGVVLLYGLRLSDKEQLETEISNIKFDLEKEKLFTQVAFDVVLDGVFVTNEEGDILMINPTAEQIFGHRAEEIVGTGVNTLLCDNTKKDAANLLTNYLSAQNGDGAISRRELFGCRGDGTKFPLQMSVSQGVLNGETVYISAVQDVEHQKRVEMDLRAAKTFSEQANKAKSEFVSSISHELRTPLNAVVGSAQLLSLCENNGSKSQKYINDINTASGHLLDLISSILDFSEIESGRTNLRIDSHFLEPLINECVSVVEPQAKAAGIEVSLDCENLSVVADALKLKQVLINLLSNAVKYNKENGKIVVEAKEFGDGVISIRVADTGSGISDYDLKQIFEPFSRLGRELGSIEGTGLGLALTKKLVEQMGGWLEAESTVGEGSEFTVRLHGKSTTQQPTMLRVVTQQPEKMKPQKLASLSGTKVLVVEDNLLNQAVLKNYLEHLECTVILAANGKEAVPLFQKNNFDVIFTDINMPEMNGMELIIHIRKFESTNDLKRTPIFVVTANANLSEKQKFLSSGADEYFAKPIKLIEIQEGMAKYFCISELQAMS